MDLTTLILTALGGLRLVLSNPALGGGTSVRLDQASELLGILGTLIAEGDDALDDLKAFTETLDAMAEAGRAPTRTEWDILRARAADAHDRLQAAKDELLAEEETEPDPDPDPDPEETATADPPGTTEPGTDPNEPTVVEPGEQPE